MTEANAQELLKNIALFSELNPQELSKIASIARAVRFKPGQLICKQGAQGDRMSVITAGQAQVTIGDIATAPTPIGQIDAGEVFGEVSLVDDQPRTANVVAASEVEAYEITRTAFDEMRQALDPAAYKVMRRISLTVCDRLRAVVAQGSGQRAPDRKASTASLPADEKKGFWSRLGFGG